MKSILKSILNSFLAICLVAPGLVAPAFGQEIVNGRAVSGDVTISGDVFTFNNLEVLNSNFTYVIKTSGTLKRAGLQAGKAPAANFNVVWDLKFEASLKDGGTASYGSWAGSVAAAADSDGRIAYSHTLTAINKASKIDAKSSGKLVSPSRLTTAKTKDVSVEKISEGKKLKYSVKAEPMTFNALTIGQGPNGRHPEVKVSGEMAYEVTTKDWLVNGLTFTYNAKGKNVSDKLSGGMAWDGSAYQVAFLFNDDLSKGSEVLDVKSGDLKNLVVAPSEASSVTGRITIDSGKISFDLSAQNANEAQVMNLFKFLVMTLVPMNS